MINEKLVAYIQKQRFDSVTDDVIISNLLNSGWDIQQIREGYSILGLDPDEASPIDGKSINEESSSKTLKILSLFLIGAPWISYTLDFGFGLDFWFTSLFFSLGLLPVLVGFFLYVAVRSDEVIAKKQSAKLTSRWSISVAVMLGLWLVLMLFSGDLGFMLIAILGFM